MNDENRSQEHNLAKLKELIDDIKIASLVTIDTDGILRSRPMATQAMDSAAELWFFTNEFSGKVENTLVHPQVCVSYAAPDKNRYVSVSGSAEVVTDPAKIKELWNPILKAWFPRGVDDPDLALLRVDIVSAQYWEGSSSKLVQLFGILKAIATGEDAGQTMGENHKLTLGQRIGSNRVS